MKSLEKRILKDGVIINNDILKVDSFLNHQIDVALARDLAKEITETFKGYGVNKILTIETSGIAFAYAVAEEMGDVGKRKMPCAILKSIQHNQEQRQHHEHQHEDQIGYAPVTTRSPLSQISSVSTQRWSPSSVRMVR